MMTRRQVLELTVSFGAAGAVVLACSDSSTGTGSSSSSSSSGSSSGGSSSGGSSSGGKDAASDTGSGDAALEFACRSSIAENHGHKLVIPLEDLDSTSPKTYSIIGTADHDHQVTFDATQLADLKAGVSINVTSNDGGQTHTHAVAVKCS
jgi:hypothetical protein